LQKEASILKVTSIMHLISGKITIQSRKKIWENWARNNLIKDC